MDKEYNITYLPLFYDDLDRITNYIMYKLGNKIAAENLLNEVEKEIKRRATNAKSYEEFKSTRTRKSTYYRIYVKNFIIFYRVNNNTMEVIRILYSRRNFKNLL